MNEPTQDTRDYRFVIGLLAGTAVGASLMLWLAPQSASELRQRVTDSAKALGDRASDTYRQANAHVGEAVGELTRTGQGVRNDVADAVARGAREVERFAAAARTAPAAHRS
jgi:gas vesicle protein